MLIGPRRDAAAPGRAVQKPDLQQIRLVNILQRDALLSDGGGKGLQPHGAAAEVFDDALQHPPVDAVQSKPVDLQRPQGQIGRGGVYPPIALHLRKIPHPLQNAVGDAGRPAGAARDLQRTGGDDIHAQNGRRPGDDGLQLLRRIKLQPQLHAKAIPQRRGKLARPGGGADQREAGQIQPDRPGRRPLADDDIQRIVLHGGIEHLLHAAVEPVDLVNKKHIVFIEIREQRRQIPCFFDGGAGGDADIDPHLVGDDARQRGLAQARRAVKQHMVQRLPPEPGRLNIDPKIFLGLFLAGIFR